jgi:hypothetical protein
MKGAPERQETFRNDNRHASKDPFSRHPMQAVSFSTGQARCEQNAGSGYLKKGEPYPSLKWKVAVESKVSSGSLEV